MPVEAAFEELKDFPFQDLTHTKIDHHRYLRKGIGEVIFGEGKTFEQIYDIVRSMREKELDVLATRVDKEKGGRLLESFPEGIYSEASRSFVIQKDKSVRGKGIDPHRLGRNKRHSRCRRGLYSGHLLRQFNGTSL